MIDYLPYYHVALDQYPHLFETACEIFGVTPLARVWAAECAYIRTFYALPAWGSLVETFEVVTDADGDDNFIFVMRDTAYDS